MSRKLSSSKPIKIGQILVEQGRLTEQQVFEICEAQRKTGTPFGVLAERMFDVSLEGIEAAWSQQFQQISGSIDLTQCPAEPEALSLITRRQAWQFQILPLRFESPAELLVAASLDRLPRAVTFAAKHFAQVVVIRVAETDQLREHLSRHYPMPEVSKELIQRARNLVARSARRWSFPPDDRRATG